MARRDPGTAERILDVAQDLIQRRGYCAMTLEDVAAGVGIKKPSVIHHYAGKSELGRSVIHRYRSLFKDALDEVLTRSGTSAGEALEFYFRAYVDVGSTEDKICLCGALAGEFMALPEEMKDEVRSFLEHHQDWLEAILSLGESTGEFQFAGKPRAMAKLFLDALQGSLVIRRATGNRSHIQETLRTLSSCIEYKNRRPLRHVRAR